ncbi:MAG: hypothetical protein FWH41_08945, partial [Treponema sp.]|nr:hypothetical protein [Treponema sp.]
MKKLQLAAENRFIYMWAPAGSGKTVTALLWNAAVRQTVEKHKAPKHMPLWITLDEYDNVPSVFYKLLATVLYSAQSGNKNMQGILSDPFFSSSPVEHTVRLIAEMQMDERLYTLTLDDLHLLNNTDILNSLPIILKRLPGSFTVLFLSRNQPPEHLQGLFKNEKTAVIGRDSLRFSENELKAYYRSQGRSLSDEEAGFVIMATNGLAIGINAIAKSGAAGIAQLGSGKTEYVFANYIQEHLWKSWDKNLQDFMLKTSVVNEMTEKIAAALTGRKDAGKMLRELCASNTFVSQAGKDMFRYHHLFLDFLRNMAKESGINMRPLYKAAAIYYLEARQYLIARHYAVQSGNNKIILKVIHRFLQYTNPQLDEYAAYAKIFNQDIMKKGICERHPYLYTSLMEGSWISSDTKTVEFAWDKLREYAPVIAIKYPQLLETFILYLATDYRKTFTQLINEFPRMPPITRFSKKIFQGPTITLQLPFFHRSFRDFYDSSKIFLQNDTEKLDRSFGKLFKDLYISARSCVESGFLLEQDRLDRALGSALKARAAAPVIKSPEITFCVYNQLAAVYLAMGNKTFLQKTLAETERYIKQSGAHFLDRNFLAWKTTIRLYDTDKKAAEEWLDNYFVNNEEAAFSKGPVSSEKVPAEKVPAELVPLYKVFQCFTTVRACMVLNMGGKALALLEALIQFARTYRRPMDIAEALTLKACLHWACGQRAEAASCLEETLLELQSKSFIRTIADEGAAVVPVLKRIAGAISTEDYSGKLSRTYVTEVLLAAHKTAQQHSGLTAHFKKSGKPVKLSRQQKKMLELLAQGYTN